MARRVFLHVGTAKSGTSFLQDLWWQHRDELRERGLLLPGGRRRDHFAAAAVVKGMTAVVETLRERERDAWSRLVEDTSAWPGDALITNEHFSDSPPDAAAAALADLAGAADEVHVVVTARDLGRVLPSAWQQRVKMGARQPYRRFLATVRRGEGDQKFWRYQDVAAVLGRWSAGLPGPRAHLVVVPPSGAPRDELWLRTSAVLGLDVTGLDTAARRPNDSLGLVEAELLRRINERVPRPRRTPALTRHVKGTFVPEALSGSADRESFVLPARHHGWVGERSEALVADLRASAYDVVGDLDELLPAAPRSGRTPDDATDDELLTAARVVMTRLGLTEAATLDAALAAIGDDLLARFGAQRGTSAQ
ncbi:hypothetical protein GCM10011376_14670 [Nocardioides flavus (ex Wang et al. 2016)]|uniref:Sulfotransferase family protein n=1 Tax=Nocardioides flavus (ex Wang et al. 2016) TaxID=2058780 RepID=A0ABQ3HGV3_9ACTN|nr:hypothetical protein [Nocardioides flavus (ex Wang et al. 2016)]GHE16857.1 hypothetical protein GCM10011376_14670 [Nocardioides flavus (ex Wang et al. 2016)]